MSDQCYASSSTILTLPSCLRGPNLLAIPGFNNVGSSIFSFIQNRCLLILNTSSPQLNLGEKSITKNTQLSIIKVNLTRAVLTRHTYIVCHLNSLGVEVKSTNTRFHTIKHNQNMTFVTTYNYIFLVVFSLTKQPHIETLLVNTPRNLSFYT